MSQFNSLIGVTSTLRKNYVYTIDEGNYTAGSDIVVYDNVSNSFKGLKTNIYDASTFDTTRYSTNYDVIIGVTNGVCHAVAPKEAYGDTDMVKDDTAAAYCYYRIEIDNTSAGGFHYVLYPHSGDNTEGDVSWSAGDTMDSIMAQITTGSYSGKALLADGTGIGIRVGGNSSNTCKLTDINGTVAIIDMSKYAVYNQDVKYNDDYDSTLPVINSNFKNWRGVSAQTILGSTIIPIGTNASCICNTGYNYSYRSGVNFSGWRAWASTGGSSSFITDGVNGTTNNSAGDIMTRTAFDKYVNSTYKSTTSNGKMYTYYNELLNPTTTDFTKMHNNFVKWYGSMTTLYDAYLMSHMIMTDNPTSGIVYTGLNKGKTLTDAKGKVMTVTYDYKYYPAYPPEYNALQYGINGSSQFGKGCYSHCEGYDIGLIFRDDIMAKCNSTWELMSVPDKTLLTNSMYRGTCVDYDATYTWTVNGATRRFNNSSRCNGYFRSRPVLAFNI